MITRDNLHKHAYGEGDLSAPPPLHVYSPDAQHAAWHPLAPPYDLMPVSHHPGPVQVKIPQPAGDALGADPTDPGQRQYMTSTAGMIGRLNPYLGGQ